MATETTKVWSDYDNAKNYKSGENIYNITRRNERYYAGDQWRGVKRGDLNTLTFNFIEQLVDVKVSTLMSNPLTITRKADDIDAEDSKPAQLAKAMGLMDKKNWERLKTDTLNEEMLLKCALSGLGGTYWYWDNTIKTGNDFVSAGDFKADTVDAIDVYVANPNGECIQKQDWVILAMRMTVMQAKKMAKEDGVSEDNIMLIKGDEDTTYEGYDKTENEQDSDKETSNQVTVLLKFMKKDGKVLFTKATKDVEFKKDIDTGLTRYPIAIMNWKKRQKFIYGTAEPTYLIQNQQSANKLASIRDLSAQLMGMPKIAYNRNSIANVSNRAGGTYGIDVPAGTPVSGMIQYLQPTSTGVDFDKSIDTNINLSKQLKGINDNVVGASRPENTSAIIAQQRAAGVPLESIKRRLWQYIEDVALIWQDFYENKYDMTRKLVDDDGNEIEFIGTEAKDVYLKTKVDVGESLQITEETTLNQIDQWLQNGFITFPQYLKLFPKNLVPGTNDLMEEVKGQAEGQQSQEFIQALPQEIQQVILSQPNAEQLIQELQTMSPEQQAAAIQQLA